MEGSEKPHENIPGLKEFWHYEGRGTLEGRRKLLEKYMAVISADLCEMNLVSNVTGLVPSDRRGVYKRQVIHLIEGQPLVNFLQYFLRILAEQAIRKLKFNSRSRCHTCSSNYSSIRFKLDNSLISSHFAFFIMFMNNGFLLSASCTCDYNLSYNCDSLLSVPDRRCV